MNELDQQFLMGLYLSCFAAALPQFPLYFTHFQRRALYVFWSVPGISVCGHSFVCRALTVNRSEVYDCNFFFKYSFFV